VFDLSIFSWSVKLCSKPGGNDNDLGHIRPGHVVAPTRIQRLGAIAAGGGILSFLLLVWTL